MNSMTEKIAEWQVTEIHRVRISIRIDLPKTGRTASTVSYLDYRMFDDLVSLVMPEELRMAMELNRPSSVLRYHDWVQQHERAKNIVRRISDELAWHITVQLSKDMKGD